jgi:hypothetical protein
MRPIGERQPNGERAPVPARRLLGIHHRDRDVFPPDARLDAAPAGTGSIE